MGFNPDDHVVMMDGQSYKDMSPDVVTPESIAEYVRRYYGMGADVAALFGAWLDHSWHEWTEDSAMEFTNRDIIDGAMVLWRGEDPDRVSYIGGPWDGVVQDYPPGEMLRETHSPDELGAYVAVDGQLTPPEHPDARAHYGPTDPEDLGRWVFRGWVEP